VFKGTTPSHLGLRWGLTDWCRSIFFRCRARTRAVVSPQVLEARYKWARGRRRCRRDLPGSRRLPPAGMAQADVQTREEVKSHYEVLGVGHDATQDDINKAYRKSALVLHPGKRGEDTTEAGAYTRPLSAQLERFVCDRGYT